MACLQAGTVANVVVPHPVYVRFATHFGFRPDFCEAADPESKGVVGPGRVCQTGSADPGRGLAESGRGPADAPLQPVPGTEPGISSLPTISRRARLFATQTAAPASP